MSVKSILKDKDIALNKLIKTPKKYLSDLSTKQLDIIIKLANDYYYNKSKPFIPDSIYDLVKEELTDRNPNHPTLKKIGAPVKRNKVRLPYFMPSLDKIKPDTTDKWLRRNPGPYLVSVKLDGASMELIGSKNEWKALYTRGKGDVGQDVSHLLKIIKLPKPKDIDVRFEIMMTKSDFKHFSKEFENPRNLVSSLSNATKKINTKALKRVKIVAHELLRPSGIKPSKQFSILERYGFETPSHKVFKTLDSNKLHTLLDKKRDSSKFEIDGLVVTLDKPYRRVTSGNPKYSVAFKSIYADQLAKTKIIFIEWNQSKHGLLKPRIHIEPTRLSGVTIKHITGNNARYVVKNGLGPGAIIEIIRSGDVIPKITKVIKSVKPQLPTIPFVWDSNKVDIHLTKEGKKTDPLVKAKRVNDFFRAVGVEFFSLKLVQRFIDNGLDTIFKIIEAPKSKLLKIPGVKEKLANKIRDNIDSAISNVDMSTLMYASGTFPKDMGKRRFEAILKKYPTIYKKNYTDDQLLNLITEIPGFNTKTARRFIEGLPKFKKFLSIMPDKIKIKRLKEINKKSNKLSGLTIVFTGFRDSDLEKAIMENGGNIGSGVNSKTSILLVKDKNSTSTKADKARDLGIKIYTPEKFRSKYNV